LIKSYLALSKGQRIVLASTLIIGGLAGPYVVTWLSDEMGSRPPEYNQTEDKKK